MALEGSSFNSLLSQSSTNSNVSTTSLNFMDELVKEYLLFRGFNTCLKSLEHDLKQDKDKCFRSDKITDQLLSFVYSYDLNGLLDYWTYLDFKFFSRITLKLSSHSSVSLTRKYELFLLRYYLIYSIQTSKTEKAFEFFENYASKLQSQVEWKEWYCLPFLKNPEENPLFSIYFTKNWIDTFIVSLQNFLNIVFQSVQFPRLLNYDEEPFWNKNLSLKSSSSSNFEQEYLLQEITDEFQMMHSNETQNKTSYTLISILKNLANPRLKTTSQISSSQTQAASASSTSAGDFKPSLQKITSAGNFLANKKNSTGNITDLNPKQLSNKTAKISSTTSPTSFHKNPQNDESKFTLNDAPKTAQLVASAVDSKNEAKDSKKEKQDLKKTSEPFITLNVEDYCEHKSAISHCKISKDGKLIASVDIQGIIKIWSVDNSMSTVNTLMQRSTVLCLEWDKRNNNMVYFGTNSAVVKVYDHISKRFVQELALNKTFPLVTNICSSSFSPKVLIMSSLKSSQEKTDTTEPRNHQMAICQSGALNNNLNLEKFFDLEGFYCKCSLFYSANLSILAFAENEGCSDGHLRVWDMENQIFAIDTKCHSSGIFNLSMSKDQSKICSISADAQFKVWLFDSASFHFKNLLSLDLSNQVNLELEDVICRSSELNGDANLMASSLMAFDSSDKFMFLLGKSGANLIELAGLIESNEHKSMKINSINSYSLESCSQVEIWNASHSLVLLLASTNGTIRIFKLLHQF